ncbi:hypothetical protein A2U01_0105191, partial [Trifolium medium]|nr:hypothetical protein [Trifolium medium]
MSGTPDPAASSKGT